MLINVFNYSDYRSFLQAWIKRDPAKSRGQISKLALESEIDAALLNKILKGERELTIEQGIAVADAIKLSREEHRLFYLMVCVARAGTPKLRSYLDREITSLRRSTKSFSQKMADATPLTREEQEEYMIDTLAQRIRGLLSVPGLDTIKTLAARLSVSEREAQQSIDLLLKLGLIEEAKGRFSNKSGLTYLSASKLVNIAFHRQWRLQALQRLQFDGELETNITTLVPLKKKDAIELVRALKKLSHDTIEQGTTKNADGLYTLTIDVLRN